VSEIIMLSQEIVYATKIAVHHNQENGCGYSRMKEVVLSMEEVFSRPLVTAAPPLDVDAFGNRAILETEMALTKACEVLPDLSPELHPAMGRIL
jgi:hypothetical protein